MTSTVQWLEAQRPGKPEGGVTLEHVFSRAAAADMIDLEAERERLARAAQLEDAAEAREFRLPGYRHGGPVGAVR